jgi:hypothetical protein
MAQLDADTSLRLAVGPSNPALAAVRSYGTRLHRIASAVYYLWRGECRARTALPLARKLYLWRHGFLTDALELYDLSRNDMRDYVSEYARRTKCQAFNEHPEFLDHKAVQRCMLLAQGFLQPDTVALLARGRVLLNPFSETVCNVSLAELECWLIADGGQFILKPEDRSSGKGVFLVESRDGVLVRGRGSAAVPFRLAELGSQCTLIERRIEQGEFWRTLHADSANSIRTLTLWGPEDPRPFIARAVQRIGTAATAPTDNWTGGGISAPIDLATGRLGEGRMPRTRGGRAGARVSHHPDSGAQIEGAVLPHWERIKEVVLRAAAGSPTNRYVGWDVLVDDAGTPIILEANARPGVNVLQVHGGLLADPTVRRFFATAGLHESR